MINKTIIQGRLVRDPELRTTPSGVEVCSFTVAWNKEIKEVKKECFLNCIAWRQTGVFVNNYFKKGKEIVVEGELETRKYQDKDGNNRSALELTVDSVHFCGGKEANWNTVAPAMPTFEEVDVDNVDAPF